MTNTERAAEIRAQIDALTAELAELENDQGGTEPERGSSFADGRAEALRRYGAKQSTSDAEQPDPAGRAAGVAEAARRYGARS